MLVTNPECKHVCRAPSPRPSEGVCAGGTCDRQLPSPFLKGAELCSLRLCTCCSLTPGLVAPHLVRCLCKGLPPGGPLGFPPTTTTTRAPSPHSPDLHWGLRIVLHSESISALRPGSLLRASLGAQERHSARSDRPLFAMSNCRTARCPSQTLGKPVGSSHTWSTTQPQKRRSDDRLPHGGTSGHHAK